MSNRQARREQSRTARTTRPNRPQQNRPGQKRPSGGSGGGSNMFSRQYLIAVTVIIVGLAIVLAIVVAKQGGGNSTSDQYAKDLQTAAAEFPFDKANGVKVGDDNAPLKLTEFEDFQCPFCLKYTSTQEPTLIKEYVQTGKMQITYQNLPLLGAESVKAATAGMCAADQGGDKFWRLHNLLFLTEAQAGQADTEHNDVGRFSDGNLKGFAQQVGLDMARFNACYDSPADKVTEITNQQRQAQSFGLTGTPGFLINGSPFGNGGAPNSLDDWRTQLDSILNATPTPTGNASASASGTAAAGTPTAAVKPSTTASPATSASATTTGQ
jgi:protein-disulfide isomerase